MILSALLTSVGINVGLCALFLTLYSIMRKWPTNAKIYVPRLAAEGEVQEGVGPSINWVKKAWQVTEDELLSNSGLDAVVFMRIFIFCIKVFRFAVIVGLFILLPINYLGSQLSIDFTDLPNKSMETFSISNVDDGSNKLWVHFSAVYVFTAVVCYYLYAEYDYIARKRISYFYSSKPQPNQFTVLVRSIPDTPGRSYSETVETFFNEYYPSTYLSHSIVRRTSKIKGIINGAGKAYNKIVHAESESNTQESFKQTGFMGLFGRKTDGQTQGHYDKNVDMEEHVRTGKSSGKEVSAAFVSFKSRLSAAVASHIQQGLKPTQWVTEPAPDPEDVYWPFFSESFVKVWLCKVAVFFACIFITALFLFPVLLVQGLTHLDQLERWLPFLKNILRMKIVSQVVTGYLPSLILQMFLSLVPPVMILLSSIQGYVALSQIEKSACIKMLWFTIWNVFFVNVPSGSALYMVDFVLEPRQIPELLAVAVPGQAAFFIAYVVTSGWTTTISTELFQLKKFIWIFLKKGFCCCKSDDEEIAVLSNPYYQEIPRILFFSLLGITYSFLSPLILPFVLLYFCLGYIVYHNQLLSVYTPKFETGGKFWPVVHDATIFSLILMHVIAVGIFGLKKVPLASSLTIPLPILTLVFNSYCRRRFLPSFKGYPAECLITKDRFDQNDPNLSSFFDKLTTAYRDPAMKADRHSESSESSSTTPLLQYGAHN